MVKTWPKMAKKWKNLGSFFYFFTIFFCHFFRMSGRGPFSIFLANFFPFLDFGPFSILYQAAWLASLDTMGALPVLSLRHNGSSPRHETISENSSPRTIFDFWWALHTQNRRERVTVIKELCVKFLISAKFEQYPSYLLFKARQIPTPHIKHFFLL